MSWTEVELIVLGWFLGFISSLIAPICVENVRNWIDFKKFKTNLTLELEKINGQLISEKSNFDETFGITSLVDLNSKISSIAMELGDPGQGIKTPIYDRNLDKLSDFDAELIRKTMDFYSRIGTINHCKEILRQDSYHKTYAFKAINLKALYGHMNFAIEESKELIKRLKQVE